MSAFELWSGCSERKNTSEIFFSFSSVLHKILVLFCSNQMSFFLNERNGKKCKISSSWYIWNEEYALFSSLLRGVGFCSKIRREEKKRIIRWYWRTWYMSLDAVVQRGTSIARVANTRCPSMYRRVCVERAFAAERKRYPPRASQRVFTTRRCQSAALLGVHSQPHRWLKLVISVYYSSNTSLIEREYDDTCDSCCACWFTVVFFLLFFYAHNNDTIVSKKEEGKQPHGRRRYSLHAFSLLFSIIVIGCSARTISLSHHRFPICSAFFPVPLSLKTTTKKQNDCCFC